MTDEIRIGVSSCLLGEETRYDGGHSRSALVADVFGGRLTLVPVCPEAELGMGIPREPVDLVGRPDAPRMIGVEGGEDWTARMNAWSRRRRRELEALDLCGYVFRRKSPSCGVWRVKIHDGRGRFRRVGRGLFAAEFMKAHPLVPVEEDERLEDAGIREDFLIRIFAYRRLADTFAGRWKRGDLIAFHASEKALLLSRSPRHARELGRLVANVSGMKPTAFRRAYSALFMRTLAAKATVRKHVDALRHLAGHLRGRAGETERAMLRAAIEEYRAERAPLTVPTTLLKHLAELHDAPYVAGQSYVSPHPAELMLRNRA